MANIAVSFIFSKVIRKISNFFAEKSAVMVGEVKGKFEWSEEDLKYVQGQIQDLERSNPNDLVLQEDIRALALDADEMVNDFHNPSARKSKKGYLFGKFDTGMQLEGIKKRIKEIYQKKSKYDHQENDHLIIQTRGVGSTSRSTIVSPALEKLNYILTHNLIASDEVMEMLEQVRDDDLGDTQNIVSYLTSSGELLSQRAQVWMEDVNELCDHAVDVSERFIDRREKQLRTGGLRWLLYRFLQHNSERALKNQMEYISTQLENALYRRWTFGDGSEDDNMGDKKGSRTRPAPSLSLVRLTLAKVPFFFLNGAFYPLIFTLVIIIVKMFTSGPERGARDHKPKKKKKSMQLTMWFDIADFMVFVFFYVLPPELMVFFQFGSIVFTVFAWIVSFRGSLNQNLMTIERYLAIMGALFSDIESEQGLALNKRQQMWVNQLKLVALKGQSLLASYPKPNLINKIIFAEDINDLLNEIFDISDRKNIYGLSNIQGRKKELVSTDQANDSENIVEISGTEENPQAPPYSSSYRGITDLEWKFQLIKEEKQMMDALFDDARLIGELEGRSKTWVDQMRRIACETGYVISDCDSELQHKPLLIYILRYLKRYNIAAKINGIRNKIEDAFRRRMAYGLVQLQSRAESLSTVQILDPRAQPSLILKESTIVGFDQDVEVLTAHLLTDEKARCITSIVGIQGTGKTTLARLVFENKSVIAGFDCRVWVSVPSSCTDQELRQNIANQIVWGQHDNLTTQDKTTTTFALTTLASKNHLIVVDGIETLRVLDILRETIPDSSTASRFLLTTRNANVAQKAGPRSFLHPLQLLDDQNSWILFTRNLKLNLPLESDLAKIGERIVAKCGGLPSEILKASNLLSRIDVTQEQWSHVLEQPNQVQNPWSETLNTINLPSHLRRCLFYFELFPANFVIPARRLVVLWVAEGLVQQEEDQEPPEQVAERYLIELIHLNFVQIAKRKSNGKVNTCRLPNALHEYLVTKANESRFPQVHSSTNLNAVPKNSRIRRVADRLDKKDIWYQHIHENTASHSASLGIYKDVFSFLSFDDREGSQPGQDIGNFLNLCISSKCLLQLRVLDLEGVFKPELLQNIARLTRLRYLGLRCTYLQSLPPSISSLLKLQTLDLKHTCIHTLTSSIWNMELRHLFLSETYRTRFPLKPKGAGNSLSDLQTLLGLFVDEETPVKGGLDQLVNVKKLGVACQSMSLEQETMESQLKAVAEWIVKLDYLQLLRLKSRDEQGQPWTLHLKSLKHLVDLTDMYLLGCLKNPSILSEFPPSLVELTLSHSKLEEDPMKILKDLPNLRSLSLLAESYMGNTLVSNSQGFPQLYVLKVWCLKQLKEWKIEQEAFPSLKQLEIRACPYMKMLPNGLKHVNSLLQLKLTNMPVEIHSDKNNIPPHCQVHRVGSE